MDTSAASKISGTFRRIAHQFRPGGDIETFLSRMGGWVLLAFAFAYYGYYCRVWPGPGGEGGVVALVSQRLLEGQRPIVDTFIGYNVLWFYPVVGLFKLMGPNYLGMRLFFFLLCIITGQLSFRLVLKCTGRAWISLLAGLLVVLVPGQTYRNYMPLLVVLNMTTFLSAYVLSASRVSNRLLWMAGSGVALGIAYLVRVDVGFFLSFILLGLIVVFPFGSRSHAILSHRVLIATAGLILALSGLFLTHLPVYLDASERGFGAEFAAQYRQWPDLIGYYGNKVLNSTRDIIVKYTKASLQKPHPRNTDADAAGTPSPGSAGAPTEATPPPAIKSIKISKGAHERKSLDAPQARDKLLALNLYLPIPVSLMLLTGSLVAWFRALWFSDDRSARSSLTLMTSLGCSLVLFPQYFFWQPNMVHLSEFMVPMTLTIIMSCAVAAGLWKRSGKLIRIFFLLYLAVSSTALVLYYINGCQSGGSGGIAVSLHKDFEFRGANGVHVKMNSQEFEENSAIFKIITAVSSRGEYVICYPYHPEINFMTDRPSYEQNVYADNDIPGSRFYRELERNVERHHPVVFIVNNWDINGTEDSRFYNWAWEAYRYITSNYSLAYQHGNFEVYVRPDRVNRIPKEFRAQAKASLEKASE